LRLASAAAAAFASEHLHEYIVGLAVMFPCRGANARVDIGGRKHVLVVGLRFLPIVEGFQRRRLFVVGGFGGVG